MTREASVHFDLTVGEPGARGRLQQLTAGFNSRGLSFGYQRDIFDGDTTGHTYRLGLAGASGGLALGFAAAYYRGATKAAGWDIGAVYTVGPRLTVGGVLANIGQPVVRGLHQRAALLAGATLTPFGPSAAFSATGRATSEDVVGYVFTARWTWGWRRPVGLLARLDTDGRLRRGAFAFGLSVGGRDVVGAVATTPGDLSGVDAASLYGVAARTR
ncbi:MAG: hypothetical protein HYS40_03070 [Gemmatimonadetes bacterium]|nr:hypothetical protein [Gemmatimonadota bacterium]